MYRGNLISNFKHTILIIIKQKKYKKKTPHTDRRKPLFSNNSIYLFIFFSTTIYRDVM